MNNVNKMRRGFTMIELIFVIVIIGILAAVAIPKLAATRDDAKISASVANLKTLISDSVSHYTAQGEDEVFVTTPSTWGQISSVPPQADIAVVTTIATSVSGDNAADLVWNVSFVRGAGAADDIDGDGIQDNYILVVPTASTTKVAQAAQALAITQGVVQADSNGNFTIKLGGQSVNY